MKTATTVFLLVCVVCGSAQAQLKIDFGTEGSPVEDGFEAYTATNEVSASFTPQEFSAFGTTITVALSWPSSAPAAAKQMWDRSTDNRYAYAGEHEALIQDWTGTDGREANANPFTLTISGLPLGLYSFLSYHNDGIDQTGVFSVTVKDRTGENTTPDVDLTNSAGGDNVTTFDGVGTFTAEISSNGKDDVVIEYTITSNTSNLTTAFFAMNGFEMELLSGLNAAYDPNPRDGQADVLRDIVLSWTAGEDAVAHDVYFGTEFDDVNTAGAGSPEAVSPGQTATTYDPIGDLEYGKTYYWRVDEVNAPSSPGTYRGSVWSFTTEPYSLPVADVNAVPSTGSDAESAASSMVDGAGLLEDGGHSIDETQMWQAGQMYTAGDQVTIDFTLDRLYKLDQIRVWNYNHQFEVYLRFSVKNVTVQYATEPNEWTTVGDFELAQGTGTEAIVPQSIDLGGVPVRFVRFTINSNYGGSFVGLSEVQFLYVPTFAREPEPAAGAEDVATDVELSWRPGRGAVSHQVHLGTDAEAVASGQSLAAVSTTPSYSGSLLNLLLGEKYYWMITEVNFNATPSSWESEVWDFNTPEFIVVDDMESYDDEENRIYFTWIDGIDDSTNGGSAVAPEDPPYTEQDIVHGGDQAMSFEYGLSGKTTSEADLAIGGANWTTGGATTLVLYFYGDFDNAPAQFYVKVNGQKVEFGDTSAVTVPWWHQFNIPLASLPGGGSNVTELTIGVSGTGYGQLFVDDIRLYRTAPAMATEELWIEAESATPLPAPWETADDPLASGGQYITVPDTATASTTAPSTADVAKYTFTVAGGQYQLWFRVGPLAGFTADSFWVRIPSATEMVPAGNATNPGWVQVNGLAGQPASDMWHWVRVWDADNDDVQVTFTLPAGTHTLEVSYRELTVPLDMILVTNGLDQ